MVNAKKELALRDIVSSQLRPDETVVFVTAAFVGTVGTRRRVATVAASALLSGGFLAVLTRPKAFYLAVTQQRLFVVEVNPASGNPVRPKGAPVALPRPMQLVKQGGLLYSKWRLVDGDGDIIAQIRYPLIQARQGRHLAEVLNT